MDELGNKMQVVGFDKIADKFKDEIVENNIFVLQIKGLTHLVLIIN